MFMLMGIGQLIRVPSKRLDSGRRFIVGNLRYFKFVGSVRNGENYPIKVIPKVIYPEDHKVNSDCTVFDYAVENGDMFQEWQEVYVSDVEQTQKTFPPDAVTLDTYETGKWYDVREVLPDERFDGVRVEVSRGGMTDRAKWSEKLGGFVKNNPFSLLLDYLDDVNYWKA
jgi:hypothetical protein